MSGSVVEAIRTTPKMGRRSMALSDIDPKYVSQSGIWEARDVETSRGSIRIQHLTSSNAASARGGGGAGNSKNMKSTDIDLPRFPKLEECAHFHYDHVELPSIKLEISQSQKEENLSKVSTGSDDADKNLFAIKVSSGGQSWMIQRTIANLSMLDEQLHRCVWDRTVSSLPQINNFETLKSQVEGGATIAKYVERLSDLPVHQVTCGTVLSWLELDNRGRHIVSSDDSAINTPAVAAACANKKYVAEAPDEISFEKGEMISVIDMPPPEESSWWRGKRGFQVGFFPRDYVEVIGDKVPDGIPMVPTVRRLQRLSVSSNSSSGVPAKPVLRKHGKLIAFFRSFILSRPSKRRLRQAGILRERVFSCDLAEHLLNTGHDVPNVLQCCSKFIEKRGIVDGIYRLSGVTSNIQKLRTLFDEDKIPNLEEDNAIKQDIHAVSSLLKMYFRELPNPLCTYQLYEKFVQAAQAADETRLFKMREAVVSLPPPHYRTLEYLMKHLAKVCEKSNVTGMTPKNMAIVWAPNLIRCKELECGGVAALKGIGVQAKVTEYLIRHADLIFNDKLPKDFHCKSVANKSHRSHGTNRPKSLAVTTPTRLHYIEDAKKGEQDDRKYIEVGGGPSSLPPKYHTVIDIPQRRAGNKNKRSPIQWKQLFSRNRSFSKPTRKLPHPSEITVITKNMPTPGPLGMQSNWVGRLRPVKSVESLVSNTTSPMFDKDEVSKISDGEKLYTAEPLDETSKEESKSSPVSPIADVHVDIHHPPGHNSNSRLNFNQKTHNRSISHDSYFEFGEFRSMDASYLHETLKEVPSTNTSSQELCLETLGCSINENNSCDSSLEEDMPDGPKTPPPSEASCNSPSKNLSVEVEISDSSSVLAKRKQSDCKGSLGVKDSEVQTSHTKLFDVGVSTEDPLEEASVMRTQSCVSLKDSVYVVENRVNYVSTASECLDLMPDVNSSMYEIDKQSSFDESSAESTIGDSNVQSPSIIYSPLINEDVSPIQRESSPSMEASSATKLPNIFICPLYEAGILSDDFSQSSKDDKSFVSSIGGETISDAEFPTYMNYPCGEEPYCKSDESMSESSRTPVRIYENERVYENDPVNDSGIKSLSIQELGEEYKTTSNSQVSQEGAETRTTDKDLIGENLMSDNDNGVDEALYETNVYEDIDEDEEHLNPMHCYETIEVDTQSNEAIDKDPKVSTGDNAASFQVDEEDDGAYENIRFGCEEHPLVTSFYSNHSSEPTKGEVLIHSNFVSMDSSSQERDNVGLSASEISVSNSVTEEIMNYMDQPLRSVSIEDQDTSNNSNGNADYEYVNQLEPDEISPQPSSASRVANQAFSFDEIAFIDNSPINEETQAISPKDKVSGDHKEKRVVKDSGQCSSNFSSIFEKDSEVQHEMVNINEANFMSAGEKKDLPAMIRCNSAPISESFKLAPPSSVSNSMRESFENDLSCHSEPITMNCSLTFTNSDSNEMAFSSKAELNKSLLCKRLSDPSLQSSQSKRKLEEPALWKLADAKRLANRKQSVKELLTKFESKTKGSSVEEVTAAEGPSTGVMSKSELCNNDEAVAQKLKNNSKFQHHRFSMGDIMLDNAVSSKQGFSRSDRHINSVPTLMSRSDTFHELQNESSWKENNSKGSSEPISNQTFPVNESIIGEDGEQGDRIQQAIRVAMSSVDMNDPQTRQRINKYKEERRSLLRQKISSSIVENATEPTKSDTESDNTLEDEVNLSRQESSKDINNFKSASPMPSLPDISMFKLSSSSIRQYPFSESPRKRAFIEEVSAGSQPNNTIKAIRTEVVTTTTTTTFERSKSKNDNSLQKKVDAKVISPSDDVNVKEKVAMWSMQKTTKVESYSSSSAQSRLEENSFVKTKDKLQFTVPKEKSNSLRREIEIVKSTKVARPEGGKKIKDMAAFFEAKQF